MRIEDLDREDFLEIDEYYRNLRSAMNSADTALRSLAALDTLPGDISPIIDRLLANISGLRDIRKQLASEMRSLSNHFCRV